MTTKPTVAEFFAQYAEKGVIFPDGGLRIKTRGTFTNYRDLRIALVMPKYITECLAYYCYPIVGYNTTLSPKNYGTPYKWSLEGMVNGENDSHQSDLDIIAVLDDVGNVVAGEVV